MCLFSLFTEDWIDHTRDILNFLVYYLPESSGVEKQQIPPIHLPRLPDEIFQSRLSSGFAVREIVAIGHSFGGCAVYIFLLLLNSALYLANRVSLR